MRSQILSTIRGEAGENWPPFIYAERVRKMRTRSFDLGIPPRESDPRIQYTLLGIELKVGRKRIQCPDLATARYLLVFARIGVSEAAIPYDITKISPLADDLETSWQRCLLLLENAASVLPERPSKLLRTALIRSMRDEINAVGAGEAMPVFDRETRQRR